MHSFNTYFLFSSQVHCQLMLLGLYTWLFWMKRCKVWPWARKADRSCAYSTSPGIGPIISCCSADQRGSGVGHADLNQYFPFPYLFVRATTELSRTSSRLGLWTERREVLSRAAASWSWENDQIDEKDPGRLVGSDRKDTLEILFSGIRCSLFSIKS